MTNSNGRNIAIVTGSALGLGYELTKQLIADGWFVAGIDTAFYRDSRDYVSEEKQHTFMDPGELAQVILFNLVNDANLQLPLSRMSSAGSAAMQVALLRTRRLSDPRAACTGPCR